MSILFEIIASADQSWIPAVVGALGALGSGYLAKEGQASANASNQALSERQMLFQMIMAQHAHRYEVEDLRKAGLNPILSGTGGAGAATPSGSTARMESELGAGVSSALAALSTVTQALLTKEQAVKTQAETANTIARTTTESFQPALTQEQTRLVGNQANTAVAQQANVAMDTRLKEIGARVSLAEIDKNNALTNLFKEQGFTQSEQTRLMGLNADQAVEVLKGMKNQGAINESSYGKVLSVVDRLLDSLGKLPSPFRRR